MHRARNLESCNGIVHGFLTRDGGVSQGPYESLNCGPGSADDRAKVRENRARAAAALMPGGRLVTNAQIHGAIVHVVDEKWDFALPHEGDGLVTTLPGILLGILTADCAPVLLADAERGVIGAAHAGWKGALGGGLEATIAVMEKAGARSAKIATAIGPAIGQADYEVGQDLRDRFGAQGAAFFTPARPKHFHFDLPRYVAYRLKEAGIGSVTALGLCTYPVANRFFSYRRAVHLGEPDYGRQLSAIALTGLGNA
ncbi:MAG: peptidoglycan editing factor PgeF [Rhizomicrobium sp.]